CAPNSVCASVVIRCRSAWVAVVYAAAVTTAGAADPATVVPGAVTGRWCRRGNRWAAQPGLLRTAVQPPHPEDPAAPWPALEDRGGRPSSRPGCARSPSDQSEMG